MVKYTQVLESNTNFFSTKATANLTVVFVGATNGIGLGALRAFLKHTSGASPTVYIVGRSQKSLESLATSLSELNSSAKLVPVQADDLTVIKDAQKAAEAIKEQVERGSNKIDFLIMSPGYLSLQREDNGEGLDRVQTIRFYSRMRFLTTLAPLLKNSSSPRVVNVLGAGKEGKLYEDDLALKEHYSLPAAGDAAASMVTLFLEEFQKQPGNDKIGLVHIFPGIVGGTGISIKGLPGWGQFLLNWVAFPLMKAFGYTTDEAGERVLYAATSSTFPAKSQSEGAKAEKGSDGQVGSGVYLVQGDSSVVAGTKVLTGFRAEEMGPKVYQHTIEKFREVEQ